MTKLDQVLRAAIFEIDRADRAYKSYLEEKDYLYAKALHKSNTRLMQLIVQNSAFFSAELREACLDLVEHLDVWFDQFSELEITLKPKIGDTFVFQRIPGSKAYPKGLREVFFQHLEDKKL